MSLRNYLSVIDNRLKNETFIKFIVFLYILMVVGYILPSIFIEDFFNLNSTQENPISEIDNRYLVFFLVAFVAPVFETLIFQIALIKGCQILLTLFWERLNENVVLLSSIGFSSIVFGLIHYYSPVYVIMMFVLGLFFGMIYYYSEKRKIKPFFPIFILHSLYNITVFIIEIKCY
jgi:MFS family permease